MHPSCQLYIDNNVPTYEEAIKRGSGICQRMQQIYKDLDMYGFHYSYSKLFTPCAYHHHKGLKTIYLIKSQPYDIIGDGQVGKGITLLPHHLQTISCIPLQT
jgi:hypothetical protein